MFIRKIEVSEQQIEGLAVQVISDGAVLRVSKDDSHLFEFALNDAIEETLDRDFATEVLRGVLKCQGNLRESYESDLIDYAAEMIKCWLTYGYKIEAT